MASGITTTVRIKIFAHASDFLPEKCISCFTVSIAWMCQKGEKRFLEGAFLHTFSLKKGDDMAKWIDQISQFDKITVKID
ncbi:MAG TPA: hypothetical protein H9700_00725 [Candidatus Eisenbergiella intestinipullorum]|nr:hypothetical protein [Candidatus Eisenbergiella intestinipullorum]